MPKANGGYDTPKAIIAITMIILYGMLIGAVGYILTHNEPIWPESAAPLISENKCKQKAKVDMACSRVGYEFDLGQKKCVAINGAGCIDRLPFGSLKECQEACEAKTEIKSAIVGEDFLITLDANMSTGYSWEADFDEQYLILRSKDFVYDRIGLGAGGKEVFIFAPIKAGETTITMGYGRPWESQAAETKVFKYNIKEKTVQNQDVSIATDKTIYEKGEIIKIVVNNGLNKPILYSRVEGQFWSIEYFEDGRWVNPYSKKGGDFQLTEKNIGDACYIALYERSFPEELTSQSNLTDQWNQKICPFGTEGLDKPKIVKYIESGKYRLVFSYGFEISSNDPFIISESKAVYSNEFTIKEKTSEILTPDYVLKHSGELINKSISVKGTANNNKNRVICTKGPGCNKCNSPLILEENGQSIEISGRVINTPVICTGTGTDCEGIKECFPLTKGKFYVVKGTWNGKSLDIESWTEKFAIDPRCGQKVRITGVCKGKLVDDIGYQFNSEIGKCIEKVVGGNGCRVETPFSSLEECQKTCENLQVDFYSCEKDSDCISVKAGCCGCNAGGNAKAINKNFKMDWKGECEEIALVMCPAVMSDDPSCFKKPTCISNKCVLE